MCRKNCTHLPTLWVADSVDSTSAGCYRKAYTCIWQRSSLLVSLTIFCFSSDIFNSPTGTVSRVSGKEAPAEKCKNINSQVLSLAIMPYVTRTEYL